MPRIIRAEAARADAAEIWAYIAQDNPTAADRLSESFNELFEKLADLPSMGRKAEELAHNLYCFPHGNFLIFYRPFQDGVQIVRILHGARENHFRPLFRVTVHSLPFCLCGFIGYNGE